MNRETGLRCESPASGIHWQVVSPYRDSNGKRLDSVGAHEFVSVLKKTKMQSIKVERGGVIHTYTLLEKLGNGSYSQVYKCKRTINGHDEIFVRFW